MIILPKKKRKKLIMKFFKGLVISQVQFLALGCEGEKL